MDGWVKLHRQVIDKGWLGNPQLWAVWCYCLLKATHEHTTVMVGNQQVELLRGQFVFGRVKAAEDLKTTEKKIRTSISNLVKLGNVAIKSASKYSIITIINWDTYQQDEAQKGQQKGQTRASKGPAKGHIQEQEEHKNKRKESKDKAQAPLSIPSWVPLDAWNEYQQMRRKIRKPMTAHAVKLAIVKLGKLREQGHDPEAVLNQSTLHAWQGLFGIRGDYQEQRGTQPKTFSQIREEETARVLKALEEKMDHGSTDFFAGFGEAECSVPPCAVGAGSGGVPRSTLVVVK